MNSGYLDPRSCSSLPHSVASQKPFYPGAGVTELPSSIPAPPPSHGGPGRAGVGLGPGGGSGPQEGRCSGERRMSSQLRARPRPCCLCRAQLRAPGPAEARCPPPGPAPHSPPRARNLFSRECQGVLRGLYFPGAQGAPELSRFCSWGGKRKIRGLEHPPLFPIFISATH